MNAHDAAIGNVVSAMADHPRVVVCGGPRCGKTAVAVRASERYGRPVLFGDSLIGHLPWSEASAEVARWFDLEGPWIIEGVACARALRKWLARNEGVAPSFRVARLTVPAQAVSDGQAAMAKGEATVWDEIEPALSGCMVTPSVVCGERHPKRFGVRCLLEPGHDGDEHTTTGHGPVGSDTQWDSWTTGDSNAHRI